MKLLVKLKQYFNQLQAKLAPKASQAVADYEQLFKQANDRMSRIERNYLVLLKRVLEMDGVQLVVNNKASTMNTKVMQTVNSDDHKGLNDLKPTIH